MSRKNRNARRQSTQPLQTSIFQPPVNHVYMISPDVTYEYGRIPSTMLSSKITCQRVLVEEHVQEIVDNFNPLLVNPLKVSERDGSYNVFDGAHTLAALKRLHKFENFPVDCKIFHGLTEDDEMFLFAAQDGLVTPIPKARRSAALWASKKDDKKLDMEDRATAAGFRIHSDDPTKRRLECIRKLDKIYDMSPTLFSDTLNLLYDSLHGAQWSTRANLVGGLALFLSLYGSEYNRDRFLKHFSKTDLGTLNTLAKESNSKDKDYDYATAILKVYNKGGGKAALKPTALLEYKF